MRRMHCPVWMIHGPGDADFLPGALNDTWQWQDNDLTMGTILTVVHFVQHAAADKVPHRVSTLLNLSTAQK